MSSGERSPAGSRSSPGVSMRKEKAGKRLRSASHQALIVHVLRDCVQRLGSGCSGRFGEPGVQRSVGAVDGGRAHVDQALHGVSARRLEHIDASLHVGGHDAARFVLLAGCSGRDHRRVHHARRAHVCKRLAHAGRIGDVGLHHLQRAGQARQLVEGRFGRWRTEGYHSLASRKQVLEQIQADEPAAAGHQSGRFSQGPQPAPRTLDARPNSPGVSKRDSVIAFPRLRGVRSYCRALASKNTSTCPAIEGHICSYHWLRSWYS